MEINYSHASQTQPLEGKKYPYRTIAVATLVSFHFFGLLGMHSAQMQEMLSALTPFESFASLTPLNLIVTCTLLLSFHKEWNSAFALFVVACFATGFLVEVAGVHTGVVFGEYAYGKTLGWKLWEVPLTIGLNWLVLVYATGTVLARFPAPDAVKAMLVGLLMTALDFLIEPVAIRLDFWSWAQEAIPLQNYMAWWLISSLLGYLFFRLKFERRNGLAVWVLASQAFFFLGHNLLMD